MFFLFNYIKYKLINMLLFVFVALASTLRIPKDFTILNLERTVTLTDRYVKISS